MFKVNHKELSELIKGYYNKKLALFVWGEFGIGKSQVVLETAQKIAENKSRTFVEWNKISKDAKQEVFDYPEKYFALIDERLASYDASDLRGLPDFKSDRETIDWKIPFFAKFLTLPNSDGILFFDEISLGTPLVMASCYQILYDRVVNEHRINNNWLIIGAGNTEKDRAFVHTIPQPLLDRGGECELLPPDTDDWITNFAVLNSFDSRIIGFLNFKKSNLHKIDFDSNQKQTSCRGWERVNTLINGVPLDEISLIVKSAIGEGIAIEFVSFCKISEKLKLEEIIKNPEKIKKIKDISVKFFLVSALAERYKDKELKFDTILKASEVLDEMNLTEFVALLWRLCISYSQEQFKKDFLNSKGNDAICKKYERYIV